MIVLDTHIWHWWVNQIPGKLSSAAIALIEESDAVGVSGISCFEMAWLVRHGRIDLDNASLISFDVHFPFYQELGGLLISANL